MENNEKKKVIRFQSRYQLNIGLIIFVLIIIYIGYIIFNYFGSYHVAEYEVQEGVIASDNTYRGLILRDESVIYSDLDGYINYYIKNGTKVAATDIICSIDTDGSISSQITAAASTTESIDSAELNNILESLDKFSNSYSSINYQNVYAFKADLASELNQSLSSTALADLSSSISLASGSTFYQNAAGKSGVVTYYIDGKESLTSDNYEPSDLISTGYARQNLDENTEIKKGDPIYKLVNNENWNIIIQLSASAAEKFQEISSVKVRFTKDDTTFPATCTLEKKEGNYYLNLALRSGMIRYISDRYEEIELILGNNEGLKIPVSAMVTKEFFKVSADYFSGSTPYLRVRSGGGEVEEVTPTIYYYDDGYYYISNDVVSKGDVIICDDTQQTYTIGTDVAELEGVYDLNKGYAVFRHIEIDSSNDDYIIVKRGTNRGISLYDHIALDGSKVQESQTIIR